MINKKTHPFVYLIIFLVPFLLFYWIIPFLSDLTIHGDTIIIIKHQLEFLFSIKTGSFPLYAPGFAKGGHSSIAMTLAQGFHPVSHMASILPGYWDGKAIEWNNFIKLLSLCITQLVLFRFLRKMNIETLLSFLLSFITTYNLRVIVFFRFAVPLEAHTGYLLLCSIIGLYFISPQKRLSPLAIIGVTYMLICSGQPPDIYYGLLAVGLFTFVAPFFISTILPDRRIDIIIAIRFWSKVGFSLCLGLALSSAYVLPFYFDFISDNVDRVNRDYTAALAYKDTFIGTLSNFFFPLRSNFYSSFGGSSLYLVAAILPVLRLTRVKIPVSVWVIWGFFLFMFLHTFGELTPVHKLAWQYLPFASSIRGAGRISIIMPFFIMLMLVWIIKADPISLKPTRILKSFKPPAVLAFISSLLIIILYLFSLGGYHKFKFPIFLKLFPPVSYEYYRFQLFNFNFHFLNVEFYYVLFGLISLTALIFYSLDISARTAKISGTILFMTALSLVGFILRHDAVIFGLILFLALIFYFFHINKRPMKIFVTVLVVTFFLQVGIIMIYTGNRFSGNPEDTPTLAEMKEQKKRKLDFIHRPGGGYTSSVVLFQHKNSFLEPYLGKIFTHVIPVSTQNEAYEKMRESRSPQQVFIENYDINRAQEITEAARGMKAYRVNLIYSSFNRLRFRVFSETPAIFGLSYPYTGHWRAWLNGSKLHSYRANGAAHAVEIPAGESILEFRYWCNAAFWGMIISCSTFTAIGVFTCFSVFSGLRRISGITFVLLIGIGGFMLWHNSLYSGDNLETEYLWKYTPPQKNINLAYGKKTWAPPTGIIYDTRGLDISSGLLVDGNSSPGSGDVSHRCKNRPDDYTSFSIDLNQLEQIKTIVLYEGDPDPTLNIRPLEIMFSHDGVQWTPVHSVVSPTGRQVPLRLIFETPETARFIQIRGKGCLKFDEIEVYSNE